ncbi:hypothetical protein [uncultured Thomasclavelia sp.]|uniref:hypothetical protein n=1 Tax=uncultured Thomasclavelia sp. TaxID=3025759 RepID=UPI0025EED1B8|nr:hypothetical protein [uncultured Thomasclavelia sp.]
MTARRIKLLMIVASIIIIGILIYFGFAIQNSQINYTLQYQFTSGKYLVKQNNYPKIIKIELNLDQMDDEVGKKILIDGNCFWEIVSFTVDNHQYDVCFKSHGDITNDRSVYFTCNKYIIDDEKVMITTNTMVTTNGNNWYHSSYSGFDEDGDRFGFSIEKDKIVGPDCVLEFDNVNRITLKKDNF